MEEEGRSSQEEEIMQDEVDAIILVHPRNCLEKILKMICGELIASFVLLSGKQHYIIAVCESAGMVDIDIRRIMNSFEVFSKEITVNRLVRGLIVPHLARKRLLLLHARFCYNLAVMLLVRSEKLLRDVISLKTSLRSKRRFEQLLNLDFCFDEDEPWPTFVFEELPPLSPLERITDQDPGLYLLETLERSGALEQHLLPEDEPMRPVEIEEAPNFGMPAEIIWDTDAIINWLPEELRPSSLFGQELNEPEQKKLFCSICRFSILEKCLMAVG
ncbi:uncharacterized protein LOC111057754 [Nilaparvata lugens]|uniref:uncharacterized protein LOC111057754 n=1 Tax=Nilaparvata lugens TaxID=108931 RepID=UPI00193DC39F|nr:uncharacterized protein LOC111057754 [Nilaparvata lugens]